MLASGNRWQSQTKITTNNRNKKIKIYILYSHGVVEKKKCLKRRIEKNKKVKVYIERRLAMRGKS